MAQNEFRLHLETKDICKKELICFFFCGPFPFTSISLQSLDIGDPMINRNAELKSIQCVVLLGALTRGLKDRHEEVPMVDCKYITWDMLTNPVSVRINDGPADFLSAKYLADHKAKELSSDPMLLAWFDRKRGTFSPDVICCGDIKPSWLVYADSRGADISVDINDLDYVFVYKDVS